MTWDDTYLALFDRCTAAYQKGERDFQNFYAAGDLEFLTSIGCKPREFFDFIEDLAEEGEPAASTALLVAAARRDYFLTVQNGVPSDQLLTRDDLPTFGDELDGLPYLPRLIAKGRAKLRGELDPDLMFCCGGDRNFLGKYGNIHPADFLRHVWASHDDDLKIAGWVKARAASA